MKLGALSVAAVGLALGVSAFGAAGVGAQDGVTTAGNNRVQIELNCDGTPETTKITNKGSKDLEIRKLTSLVDPEKREPFKINETLKKGQSIKFETGKDARGQDELSKKEIYDDADEDEGGAIRTSAGTITEKCDD